MGGAPATRSDAMEAAASRKLFARIGEFLAEQRLEPDPGNYAFAHAILANPRGPLAKAVASLTDGGIRLTRRDVESLGGEIVAGSGAGVDREHANGLVAQTQLHVEGFEDVIEELREETRGFGRDLAASADAIRRTRDTLSTESSLVDEVARLTAAMVERVHIAEEQMEKATREAAELRSKLEEARDDALRDPLTDLPNRRAFEEAYAAKAEDGGSLLLAVCDIDHFKAVNDRFGHAVGDRVLKAIARALQDSCGDHLVARFGGEEFVILFSDVDAAAARGTLEAARAAIELKRYKLRETDAPLGAVTVSAGLAVAGRGESVKSAFQRADALLYRAKGEGRNRVVAG